MTTAIQPREILKAHVKSHYRVVNGKVVHVADHDDSRPQGRAATLHERTAIGKHKGGTHYLRATDAEDGEHIKAAAQKLGIPVERRRAGATHHGRTGAYDHYHVQDPSQALAIHEELKKQAGKKESESAGELSKAAEHARENRDHKAAEAAHWKAAHAHEEAAGKTAYGDKAKEHGSAASYHQGKAYEHAKAQGETDDWPTYAKKKYAEVEGAQGQKDHGSASAGGNPPGTHVQTEWGQKAAAKSDIAHTKSKSAEKNGTQELHTSAAGHHGAAASAHTEAAKEVRATKGYDPEEIEATAKFHENAAAAHTAKEIEHREAAQAGGNPPSQKNDKPTEAPEKAHYFKGDKIKFTGNTKDLHGGTFHEFEYIEGHKKGQLGHTQYGPDAGWAKPKKDIEKKPVTPQIGPVGAKPASQAPGNKNAEPPKSGGVEEWSERRRGETEDDHFKRVPHLEKQDDETEDAFLARQGKARQEAMDKEKDGPDETGYEPTGIDANEYRKRVGFGKYRDGEYGMSGSAIIHPEHEQKLKDLKHGESSYFKDEQGHEWDVKRHGEDLHFKARGLSGLKGKVKHSDLFPESGKPAGEAVGGAVKHADTGSPTHYTDAVKKNGKPPEAPKADPPKQSAGAQHAAEALKHATAVGAHSYWSGNREMNTHKESAEAAKATKDAEKAGTAEAHNKAQAYHGSAAAAHLHAMHYGDKRQYSSHNKAYEAHTASAKAHSDAAANLKKG
jgi:hypothetical protein